MKLLLAAMLAAPAATSAPPTGPITLDCDMTETLQSVTNMGRQPFDRKLKHRKQRFTIDPRARTVTLAFQCGDPERCDTWVERPMTFSDVLVTPGGHVVFCTRLDHGPCNAEVKKSGGAATVTGMVHQTIITLGDNTVTGGDFLQSSGNDGSFITITSMHDGRCRRS